jgi:hypothetical protein
MMIIKDIFIYNNLNFGAGPQSFLFYLNTPSSWLHDLKLTPSEFKKAGGFGGKRWESKNPFYMSLLIMNVEINFPQIKDITWTE